ncbi:MAG: type I phosphomannose isomerase catalytic subunit, partial [Aeromicrobium sp.]
MFLLSNGTRAYEWGSRAAIPSFLGRDSDGNPVAELWMGTHPLAPSS